MSPLRTAKQLNPAANIAHKEPVGNQLICLARTARLIDPLWMVGPVPKSFWQDKQNRRNYLLWLG